MLQHVAKLVDYVADRPSRTVLFSLVIASAFAAFDFMLSELSLQTEFGKNANTIFQAIAIGVAVGLISLLFLTARKQRRKLVGDELRRLMHINDRLRNSLQVIAFAKYANEEHRKVAFEAIGSMEKTLQQLFPSLGFDRRSRNR